MVKRGSDDCRDRKMEMLAYICSEFNIKNPLFVGASGSFELEKINFEKTSRGNRLIDFLYINNSGNIEKSTELFKMFSREFADNVIICLDHAKDDYNEITNWFENKFKRVCSFSDLRIYCSQLASDYAIRIVNQTELFDKRIKYAKMIELVNTEYPTVTVIVLAYGHENFILQCLESVIAQEGNFRLKIIIIDDASMDNTAQMVEKFKDKHRNLDNIDIAFHKNSQNIGVVKNIYQALELSKGCDYFTFCEGDDYWCDVRRIAKHLIFLTEHSECSMSFNAMKLYYNEKKQMGKYKPLRTLSKDFYTGMDLAEENFIGNFSCCFYRGSLLAAIPAEIFEFYTVDWMINLYCAKFGLLGHLPHEMTIYRQHNTSEWSSQTNVSKGFKLVDLIDVYNRYLDFEFNEQLMRNKFNIIEWIYHNHRDFFKINDLVIIDDVFPSAYSGFRYSEFSNLLKAIPNSSIFCTAGALACVDDRTLSDVILEFCRKFPEIAGKVYTMPASLPPVGRIIYSNFLRNTYELLPWIENNKVPFVFTLYPGGGFMLKNEQSDKMLKRVMESPGFNKVIVTQHVTYNYLLSNNFCTADKIKMIFGVVVSESNRVDISAKRRFGIDKDRLDICFAAHKYTQFGEDKGYDVFINIAHLLCHKYDNVFFHVAGSFDAKVINTTKIANKIKFYGVLQQEQFDSFFSEMDIILSPNISNKLALGAFDGFPTSSCTEASLRGVAMFCIDEFASHSSYFEPDVDFVSIHYDINHIMRNIEYYLNKPHELKQIGENGAKRSRELYSYEKQLEPRISLLKSVINQPLPWNEERQKGLKQVDVIQNVVSSGKVKKVIKKIISEPKVKKLLKKYVPEYVKDFYRQHIKYSIEK